LCNSFKLGAAAILAKQRKIQTIDVLFQLGKKTKTTLASASKRLAGETRADWANLRGVWPPPCLAGKKEPDFSLEHDWIRWEEGPCCVCLSGHGLVIRSDPRSGVRTPLAAKDPP